MKIKKLLTICLLLALVLTTIILNKPITAEAATSGDYTYKVSDGEVIITDYTGAGGDITIPSSLGGYPVTKLTHYLFQDCDSLTSVVIPDSVTTLYGWTFRYCDNLTNVTIGSNVTYIGQSAFEGCGSLAEVIIPNSVTAIYNYTFRNCSNLTSLTIGSGVTTIGEYAFENCDSLTSVVIPNNVTAIGDNAFSCCDMLTDVVIGNGVTTVGGSVFGKCRNLASVVIGNSITQIGSNMFTECDSLTHVTIPVSVTTISSYAFSSCDKLTSIIIPVSVTNIHYGAFQYCDNLRTVCYTGSQSQWEAIDISSGNKKLTNATIYCNYTWCQHDYTADPTTCGNCGFVRAELGITSVVLRPSVSGIYFKGAFTLGEGVVAQRQGIAVSVENALPVADDSDPTSLYTNGYNSALIKNILSSTNGKTVIYARAYILLEDGTYIYGDVVETSLYQMVLAVEQQWSNLTDAQKAAIKEMYNTFSSKMQSWLIPEIKKYG